MAWSPHTRQNDGLPSPGAAKELEDSLDNKEVMDGLPVTHVASNQLAPQLC